jgi:hypothetical protein
VGDLYGAIKTMHKGALHRALGVPQGERIPADKMAEARSSSNPHVRRMAAFARALSKVRPG